VVLTVPVIIEMGLLFVLVSLRTLALLQTADLNAQYVFDIEIILNRCVFSIYIQLYPLSAADQQ
jgi:hypothetical protein